MEARGEPLNHLRKLPLRSPATSWEHPDRIPMRPWRPMTPTELRTNRLTLATGVRERGRTRQGDGGVNFAGNRLGIAYSPSNGFGHSIGGMTA